MKNTMITTAATTPMMALMRRYMPRMRPAPRVSWRSIVQIRSNWKPADKRPYTDILIQPIQLNTMASA